MWTASGDLVCDMESCAALQFDLGSKHKTLNAARARGWHLFDGVTMGGKDLVQHLCEDCVGTSARLPKIKHFDDEQTLW